MSGGVPLLGQQSLPAGVSAVGVLLPTGLLGILPLTDLFYLVTLHALVSRESANLASTDGLAGLAAKIARDALAVRGLLNAPASPVAAPASPAGNG